jgi:hypothetical protein
MTLSYVGNFKVVIFHNNCFFLLAEPQHTTCLCLILICLLLRASEKQKSSFDAANYLNVGPYILSVFSPFPQFTVSNFTLSSVVECSVSQDKNTRMSADLNYVDNMVLYEMSISMDYTRYQAECKGLCLFLCVIFIFP